MILELIGFKSLLFFHYFFRTEDSDYEDDELSDSEIDKIVIFTQKRREQTSGASGVIASAPVTARESVVKYFFKSSVPSLKNNLKKIKRLSLENKKYTDNFNRILSWFFCFEIIYLV